MFYTASQESINDVFHVFSVWLCERNSSKFSNLIEIKQLPLLRKVGIFQVHTHLRKKTENSINTELIEKSVC